MSAESCSISINRLKETTIVKCSGEIDSGTVSVLARALQNAARSGKKHIILDATELTYIDSSGILTLISFQQKLQNENRRLAIIGCHGIFRKLITLSRLENRLPMYTSLDEALAEANAR
ncbi:MAG: STAS domain-containing protein [Armatimonadota bacterium]|nr:STAS domain-containing protein [Armatimonadota bacterium]